MSVDDVRHYASLSLGLDDAAPAVLDGLEVVEEQVVVLGPPEPELPTDRPRGAR